MSLPWIKVYVGLPDHSKADALGLALRRPRAWTHVLELWLWAAHARPDGDLSGMPAAFIARRAGWKGDAEEFVAALRSTGWLDGDRLHDFDMEQSAHRDKMERDREHARRRRESRASRALVARPSRASRAIVALEKEKEKEKEKELSGDTPETPTGAPKNPDAPADAGQLEFTPAQKPKRKRAPKESRQTEPDPSEKTDRELYRDRFRTLFGSPNADFTQPGVFAFRALRDKHGLATMLQSLVGLATDDWCRKTYTLARACSQEGVDLGTRMPSRDEAADNRDKFKTEPEFGTDWLRADDGLPGRQEGAK